MTAPGKTTHRDVVRARAAENGWMLDQRITRGGMPLDSFAHPDSDVFKVTYSRTLQVTSGLRYDRRGEDRPPGAPLLVGQLITGRGKLDRVLAVLTDPPAPQQ